MECRGRLRNGLPAVCAADIARAQRTPFQIAERLELEQRMIAGAAKVGRLKPERVTLFWHLPR
jgi:hypothetical protein